MSCVVLCCSAVFGDVLFGKLRQGNDSSSRHQTLLEDFFRQCDVRCGAVLSSEVQ